MWRDGDPNRIHFHHFLDGPKALGPLGPDRCRNEVKMDTDISRAHKTADAVSDFEHTAPLEGYQ